MPCYYVGIVIYESRGMNFVDKLAELFSTSAPVIGCRLLFFERALKLKKQILIPISKNHVALTHAHSI